MLTAYTRTGLARGDKVLIVKDPSDLDDDQAVALMDGGTGDVEAARESGQLVFESNMSVYLPDGRFDKERQIARYSDELERARSEGWPGIRASCDMTWALQPDVDGDAVVDYEASVGPLFADPTLTAICWYSQQQFRADMVAAVSKVHPMQVMDRLDAIKVTRTPNGGRIAGSAELSTRMEFVEALREALDRPEVPAPFHFELDLTDLCYMEAHCAWQLISFAESLPEGSKVSVRSGPLLALVLQGLGADTVAQLEISVEEES